MTCSQDEPSRKKQKMSDYHIEAVVDDEVRDPVPLVPVLTARIRNKKLTSKIVKNLNDHFPISQLSHLKRVNNRLVDKNNVLSVILWSCDSDADSSVEDPEVMKRLSVIQDLDLSEAFEDDLQVCQVASFQPLTTAQYNKLRSSENYW